MWQQIWDWLDGNKSLFGMVVLYFAEKPGLLFGSSVVEDLAMWVGSLLLGGGMVHKLAKGIKNTGK